ncbi:MAG TPA: WYL domain-containing protein [Candidatus Nanopelagicus sp.]|nr:WYL domain-containing protein [Candidatus Nanopelagicus sp.]
MSSQKTERLINLTLALLASKRYLSKAEILRNIPGYEGSPETKERMFERDKDDLRSLGIQIDVNNSDPLFEDEQGYLIKSESFQFAENEFTKEELLLLTMAANLWHDSAVEMDSQNALLKIQSLSGPVENDMTTTPTLRITEDWQLLVSIFTAVQNKQILEFSYRGKKRQVNPYGLYSSNGFWYLIAFEINVIKSFKLVRIEGEVDLIGEKDAFEKPDNFNVGNFLKEESNSVSLVSKLQVRKGAALSLRNKFTVKDLDSEWDLMDIPYTNEQELLEMVLWHGTDLKLIEPAALRQLLVANLKSFLNG